MKKRNHTFDFLCGLCIIRMVLLHCFQVTGYINTSWWDTVMSWSFYLMCFFFFKAGYFNRSVGGPTLPCIIDRSKRLLLPYITCGLIGTVLFWSFMLLLEGEYKTNPVRFLWQHVYKVSDFYGNPPMWFLMSFYTMYLSVHFIEKVRHLHWISLSFPFIGYWLYSIGNPLWLSLNNLFIGIFFFYQGHRWRHIMAKLGRIKALILSAILTMAFALGNIFYHGIYTMHTNSFTGNPWGATINTILIVCGLSGLLLSLKLPRIPLINYIGQHSMVYFVLHFPIIYIYMNVSRYIHVSLRQSPADAIIILVLVFGLCTLATPWFERIPFLSGRWPKSTATNKTPDTAVAPPPNQ